jgi:hypothetical protein
MKSPLEQLSANEREALALLYDKPDWKALTKLINIERIELAKDAIEQKDIADVRYLAGQSDGLKRLLGTIRNNFKAVNKEG